VTSGPNKTEEYMNKTLSLYYIGDEFYRNSDSMMSSIYEVRTHKRYHWGFVTTALSSGIKVSIRPATKKEMKRARKLLKEYLDARDERVFSKFKKPI
jgi:hypothetical protein